MSTRFTSAFDDLLAKNRRELDALYQGAGPSPSRSTTPASGPRPASASGTRTPDPVSRDEALPAPRRAGGRAASRRVPGRAPPQ